VTKESRLEKADRLVREGRVQLLVVTSEELWEGLVLGDSGEHYLTGRNPERRYCECPHGGSRDGGCSHYLAAEAAVLAQFAPKGGDRVD
jgi:hypothetical protein